jgi:TolB-like protein
MGWRQHRSHDFRRSPAENAATGLKVIARTSAFAFKGKNEDIRKVAETLGVSNVLEGSVRRAAYASPRS